MKFYKGDVKTQLKDRIYNTPFYVESEKGYNWELSLNYPQITELVKFQIKSVFYSPKGDIIGTAYLNEQINRLTDKKRISGRIPNGGKVSLTDSGEYKLELYVNEKLLTYKKIKLNSIYSKINTVSTTLKFFNAFSVLDKDKRVYSTSFSLDRMKKIYPEVNLKASSFGEKVNFKLKLVFYDKNGTAVFEKVKDSYLKSGWLGSYHIFDGLSRKDLIAVKPGSYNVVLFLNNMKLGNYPIRFY